MATYRGNQFYPASAFPGPAGEAATIIVGVSAGRDRQVFRPPALARHQRWARGHPDRLLARPDTPSEGVQARCPGDHACAGRRNTARWSRRGQQCYP